MQQLHARFAQWITMGKAYNLAEAQRLSFSLLRHCPLHGQALTDACPSRASAGVQMATRQRVVPEHNQQECLRDCPHVEF